MLNKKFLKSTIPFILTILFALSFRSFFCEFFKIPSGSMQSTMLIGDYVLVNKMPYGYSRYSLPFNIPLIPGKIFARDPDYGDVVVFRPPYKSNLHFVKRLVGKPGDRIRIHKNILYINDIPSDIENTGVIFEDKTEIKAYGKFYQYIETMPNGLQHNILLSKNPNLKRNYDDSKEYIVPEGHFFMIGDNRYGSKDSRFLEVGFIPRANIIGRVSCVMFSIDKVNKWFRKDRFLKSIK